MALKSPILVSIVPQDSAPSIDIYPKKRRSHGMPDPVIDDIMKPQHTKRERKPTKRFLEADSDSELEKSPDKHARLKADKLNQEEDKTFVPENKGKSKSVTPEKGAKRLKGGARKKTKSDGEAGGPVLPVTGSEVAGAKEKEYSDLAEVIGGIADEFVPKKRRRSRKVKGEEQSCTVVGTSESSAKGESLGMLDKTPEGLVVQNREKDAVQNKVQSVKANEEGERGLPTKRKRRRKNLGEGMLSSSTVVRTSASSAKGESLDKLDKSAEGLVVQNQEGAAVQNDQVQSVEADEGDSGLPTKRKRWRKNLGEGMLSTDDFDLRLDAISQNEKSAHGKNLPSENVIQNSGESSNSQKKTKRASSTGKGKKGEQKVCGEKAKLESPEVTKTTVGTTPKSRGRKNTGASAKKIKSPDGASGKSVISKKKCAKKLAVDTEKTAVLQSDSRKSDSTASVSAKLGTSQSDGKTQTRSNSKSPAKSSAGSRRGIVKVTKSKGEESATLIDKLISEIEEDKEMDTKKTENETDTQEERTTENDNGST
jgi:hypothetical protein